MRGGSSAWALIESATDSHQYDASSPRVDACESPQSQGRVLADKSAKKGERGGGSVKGALGRYLLPGDRETLVPATLWFGSSRVQSLSLFSFLVGATGFEPATSCRVKQ